MISFKFWSVTGYSNETSSQNVHNMSFMHVFSGE